jgi:hypothetical protein
MNKKLKRNNRKWIRICEGMKENEKENKKQ